MKDRSLNINNISHDHILHHNNQQLKYLKKLPTKKYSNEQRSSNFLQQKNSQFFYQKPSTSVRKQSKQQDLDNQSTTKNTFKNKNLQKLYCCQNCLKRSNNHQSNIDNCCIRLFTFMGSTQKNRFYQPQVSNDVNLDFLDQIPDNQNNSSTNSESSNLVSFIENSRRKREEFLCNLKQLQILEGLDNPKNNEQNVYKPTEQLIFRTQSATNRQFNINSYLLKPNFSTRNLPYSTNSLKPTSQLPHDKSEKFLFFKTRPKSSRVTMKQNLKNKHFSQPKIRSGSGFAGRISLSKLRQPIVPRLSERQFVKPKLSNSRTNFQSSKSKVPLYKRDPLQKSPSKRSISKPDNLVLAKDSSGLRASKRSVPIASRNFCTISNKQNQNIENQDMGRLMRRKKELETQLTSLNEEIVLFNKKKPQKYKK